MAENVGTSTVRQLKLSRTKRPVVYDRSIRSYQKDGSEHLYE